MASRSRSSRRSKSAMSGRRGYPRPQLVRENWIDLNGQWDFAIDANAELHRPGDVRFNQTIEVPFAPETPASGINDTGFYKAVWYRRSFECPKLRGDERLILHFGAVDHEASVWINGSLAARHEGGYTPFDADITDLLTDSGKQTIVVRAFDDPHDLAKPRGKQDWKLEPHSIWYARTTGIWQTVWIEVVSAAHIASVKWTPNLAHWSFGFQAVIAGASRAGLRLRLRLHVGDRTLAQDEFSIDEGEVNRTVALLDPGIDDARNDLLWRPGQPTLIDADIELRDGEGNVLDSIKSYTAMRSVAVDDAAFLLNGRPFTLRLVLDQGYWPQSGLTAPDDEALRRDVELVMQLGFNGVRKHQKIEDPRFLYWADKLGLLVWEEMPSPYRFCPQSIHRLTNEWSAAIARDASHPCIIAWVPFNESWGVPDLTESRAQRDLLRGIYYLTKSLDPTRPVIGNDGWEMVATDILAVHDYDGSPERVRERYTDAMKSRERFFATERPGHRKLLLDGCAHDQQPIMLTEFGGIAYSKDVTHTWGYRRATTAKEFASQYADLLAAVRAVPMLGGFCYTQFTDTYQEANGLLYMDRKPKAPLAVFSKATRG